MRLSTKEPPVEKLSMKKASSFAQVDVERRLCYLTRRSVSMRTLFEVGPAAQALEAITGLI